jgi:hypothetical protein
VFVPRLSAALRWLITCVSPDRWPAFAVQERTHRVVLRVEAAPATALAVGADTVVGDVLAHDTLRSTNDDRSVTLDRLRKCEFAMAAHHVARR